MAQANEAKVWLPLHLSLGESLLYDGENDRLFIEDILEKHLYIVDLKKDPEGNARTRISLDDNVGVIGLISGDEKHLIAAAKRGVGLIAIETGDIEYLCKFYPPEDEATHRANDGCIDAKGRLWSGTMSEIGISKNTGGGLDFGNDGFLFRFDPDGSMHRVLEGCGVPNGMNFSADNKTFYIIDSTHECIYAYDYDLSAGTISNERVLIKFSPEEGAPDGAHIDSKDRIYVAMAFGKSNVLIVDPGKRGEGDGKIVGQIDVPTSMTVCPTFGGQDLKDLYIASGGVEHFVATIRTDDVNWGHITKASVNESGTLRKKFGPVSCSPREYVLLGRGVAELGKLGKQAAPAKKPSL